MSKKKEIELCVKLEDIFLLAESIQNLARDVDSLFKQIKQEVK